MKVCPKCHMTVDAEGECPFCYTTLTYEPTVHSDKEHYVLNKYLVGHLLKQSWFSLLCLIVVALKLALTQETFVAHYHLWPPVFAVVSLLCSLFERRIIRYVQWEYAVARAVVAKFSTGLAAVVLALGML